MPLMKRIWKEMFPHVLDEQLEFLHDEALELARRLKARRNEMQLNPHEELAKEVQSLFKRVRDKDDLIGVTRGTRILRHRAGEVYGLDPSARHANIEEAAAWVDLVVENIEHVMDVLDRRRILWWTLVTAVAAAIAAAFAFFALVFDVTKTVLFRS
jgi:hypothetical protein